MLERYDRNKLYEYHWYTEYKNRHLFGIKVRKMVQGESKERHGESGYANLRKHNLSMNEITLYYCGGQNDPKYTSNKCSFLTSAH